MVDDAAQLYTIEGVAAGVIMLFTAFVVLSTTTVYAPGDTHLSEMQLEQMAYDALAMMDTPDAWETESDLTHYIMTNNDTYFNATFLKYMGYTGYGLEPAAEMFPDEIQYSARVYYRDIGSGTVESYPFAQSYRGEILGHEPAVTATRLVYIPDKPDDAPGNVDTRDQIVLMEVLVWRG
jgi:hypothetical protein